LGFSVANMARRAANITQADLARAIRAAKQAGAIEVEVRIGDRDAIIIRIAPSTRTQVSLEESSEIVL
jgi:DNA-binding XRE family transcriptional regulator